MNIVSLASPIIDYICELRRIAAANVPLEMEAVRARVRRLLQQADEASTSNLEIAAEYNKIRLALIFYIDYMIKEGPFQFRDQWEELARQYKELSGDEKFFDLLDESLNDPGAAATERLKVFFLCMATGFDGCHKAEPELVERKMKICALRIGTDFKGGASPHLSEDAYKHTVSPLKPSRPFRNWRIFLASSIGLLLIALLLNLYMFDKTTRPLSLAIDRGLQAGLQGDTDSEHYLLQRFLDIFKSGDNHQAHQETASPDAHK